MALQVFVCYKLSLPDSVKEDLEQEMYSTLKGEEGGECHVEMFIDAQTYPALRKHLEQYGIAKNIKLFVELKTDG